MKNLIIIGAGGMGREVYSVALACMEQDKELRVKGFLDDNLQSLDGYKGYPPMLDTIANYQPQADDYFICSMGNVQTKAKLVEMIKSKGGQMLSLVHPRAGVYKNVQIGAGTLVEENVVLEADAKIGENCLFQIGAVVGHDVAVGDYSRVDCNAVLVGGITVGKRVTIHTGAVINHKVVVNDDATVGALSFVVRRVKEGKTVFGNPARELVLPGQM